MLVIVGLGNWEERYQNTRHNIGFLVLDRLLLRALPSHSWQKNSRVDCLVVKTENFLLAKPQVLMNNSGSAVKKLVNFYKINSEKLLVVHDDLDLNFGEIKISKEQGAAGHRGVKSVIEALGTKNFWRVRVGISRPLDDQKAGCSENDKSRQVTDYVLSKFDRSEKKQLYQTVNKTVKIIKQGIESGFERLEGKHGIK